MKFYPFRICNHHSHLCFYIQIYAVGYEVGYILACHFLAPNCHKASINEYIFISIKHIQNIVSQHWLCVLRFQCVDCAIGDCQLLPCMDLEIFQDMYVIYNILSLRHWVGLSMKNCPRHRHTCVLIKDSNLHSAVGNNYGISPLGCQYSVCWSRHNN